MRRSERSVGISQSPARTRPADDERATARAAGVRSFNGFYAMHGHFIMMNSIHILIGRAVVVVVLVAGAGARPVYPAPPARPRAGSANQS